MIFKSHKITSRGVRPKPLRVTVGACFQLDLRPGDLVTALPGHEVVPGPEFGELWTAGVQGVLAEFQFVLGEPLTVPSDLQ